MLIITYGNPAICSIHWQASMACYYTIYEHPLRKISQKEIEEIIETVQEGRERTIYVNVHMEHLDSPPDIINNKAYTMVNIRHMRPHHRKMEYNMMLFRHTLDSLHFLRTCEKQGILKSEVDMIEKGVWNKSGIVGEKLRRIGKRVLDHILVKLSIKYLDPDYIWKTGEHKGMSTIARFTHRWNRDISYATSHITV